MHIGLAAEEQSEVWVGQRRFDVVVRLQDHSRNDVGRAADSSSTGTLTPPPSRVDSAARPRPPGGSS